MDRHPSPHVAAVSGFDHVFLNLRPKTVLRSENRGETRARVCRQSVGDVNELVIDRRRIADDPDAFAVEC